MLDQLDTIRHFLTRYHREPVSGDLERTARVRHAVMTALTSLARAYGVHEITAWKWAAIGRIPAPVKRGKRYTRWSNAEIQRDIREMREAERREATT